MKRCILWAALCVPLIAMAAENRFAVLTGADGFAARAYVCLNVYETQGVLSGARGASRLAKIYIDGTLSFSEQLNSVSDQEFKLASRGFRQRFTEREFEALLKEYGSVLEAYCEEYAEDRQ